jgi:peroxiredoxin
MFSSCRSWIAVIAAGLAVSCMGCPSKPAQKPDKDKNTSDKQASRLQLQEPGNTIKTEEPPPPPTIPKVNLSEELRANCLVRVGDPLPKAELPDLANKSHSLSSLCGKKLTVVCVWTSASRRAQLEAAEMLPSLENDVAKPFADKGVQVIAIEVARNDVDMEHFDDVHKTASKLPFPCLVDSKGQFLASVAKDDKLPRIFLLDAEGKILWFDVEYSRSTREDLLQGIRVALGESK